MTFMGWEEGKRQEQHSFSCPIPYFKIMPIYYWALQLYPGTWHIKTKLPTFISKIYFGDSSDKAASQFIVNAKQGNASENTLYSAKIKSVDGLK